MSTELKLLPLNQAQSLIYSRTNLRRAFQGFDDSDISGIYRSDDQVIVVRNDGSDQSFPVDPVRQSFVDYTARLKNFFAYLGPNFRGPSIWHNNCYVMFKGWHYTHTLAHTTHNAKLQRQWADKFIHVTDANKLVALLQSPETDIGHLVAPDGITREDDKVDLDFVDEQETQEQSPVQSQPYCSCGSYTRQLENLFDFAAEIKDYTPTCIHITWFKRYRQFLAKRAEVRGTCRGQVAQNAVAWWYAPPVDHTSKGRFLVLYTKQGSMAPVKQWRTYKPDEVFTEDHAWDLFDNMLDNGFVPFPGQSLPQLSGVFKK